jgi:ubiquinone/menaquinone biosynthesis C-methylase UbiE
VLTNVLHWLVKHPAVYDAAMVAVGARQVEQVLREQFARLALSGVVLDVGGGTGAWRPLLPAEITHICLDLDPLKLRGFRQKFTDGVALLADASALPFKRESVDAVLCAFMAHHLDDRTLERMIDEAERVLKPGGLLVFADPLFVRRRWPGRLLWRYDRGRFPRTLEAHRSAVARRFRVVTEQRFAVVHAYVLLVGRKPDRTGPAS